MEEWQGDLLEDYSMKGAETRGLKGKVTVILYESVQNAASVVGIARMGIASVTNPWKLQRFLHNYKLGSENGEDLVVIRLAVIGEGRTNVAYPCTLKSNEEDTDSLRDMFTALYYE